MDPQRGPTRPHSVINLNKNTEEWTVGQVRSCDSRDRHPLNRCSLICSGDLRREVLSASARDGFPTRQSVGARGASQMFGRPGR